MKKPVISATAFVADGARITGDVVIGEHTGVWYNTVIRGDIQSIRIGDNTNIQDNTVIHGDSVYPVVVGSNVSVGHSAILHGCTVGDDSMVGMGSIVMNGAVIGKHCLVGAGSLVTQGTVIPDGSVAFGRPAKVIRPMTEKELAYIEDNRETYRRLAGEAKEEKNSEKD